MPSPEKILEKMRASSAGWGQSDFQRLYEGFGFKRSEGAKHTIYQHPDYPQLSAAVGRHNELANGYARTAVKIMDSLKKLQNEED